MEKEVHNIHIYGDSQIGINWISGINMIHNLQLIALFQETQRLKERLESVSIKHIYMQRKIMVDEMDKYGVNMAKDSWHVTEMQNSIKLNIFMIHSNLF